LPAIKEIQGLRRRSVKLAIEFCAAFTLAVIMHSKNSSQPLMQYLAASSLLFASTSAQGVGILALRLTLFEKI
jgi:hypothetical protein